MMKLCKTSKQILYIFRIYRKTIGVMTCRHPTDKYYWDYTRKKADGMLDLLLFDDDSSINEYWLIKGYIKKQMDRLYNIYFN